MDLTILRDELRRFVAERDWDRFHSPKNLATGLSVEAAELLEHFLWLTPEESSDLEAKKLAGVEEEIADVLIYVVMLADRLGIDPLHAAAKKLIRNAEKYPVEKAKGKAAKYSELEPDSGPSAGDGH